VIGRSRLLRLQVLPLVPPTPEDASRWIQDEHLTFRLDGPAADVHKAGARDVRKNCRNAPGALCSWTGYEHGAIVYACGPVLPDRCQLYAISICYKSWSSSGLPSVKCRVPSMGERAHIRCKRPHER